MKIKPNQNHELPTVMEGSSPHVQGGSIVLDFLRHAVRRLTALLARERVENIKLQAQIVALQAENERLEALALKDPLTGLFNRRALDERLSAELSLMQRDSERQSAIIYLDLNKFKPINDTYGHPVGDDALRLVGKALKEFARASDIVARIGGDEFVIVLGDCPEANIQRRVNELEKRFSTLQLEHLGITIPVGASIAFAMINRGLDPADNIKAADDAMYAVKQASRNGGSVVPMRALA